MYGYGYDYNYNDYETTSSVLGGLAAMMGVMSIVSLVVSLLMIISLWKIFKKAGKKGWEAIVPVYNIIVLLQIVELPMWYIALFFVPIANIYAMFKIYIELAHKFGKSTGFGVLTVFFSFVCLPMLAFGKNSVYNGNNNTQNVNNNVQPTQFTPDNTFAFQSDNVGMENNNQNTQQPFMFNQNINTEINQVPPAPQTNNVVNPMNTIPTPTPNIQNVEPSVVEQPVQQNVEPNILQQPVNPMPNIVQTPSPMVNQPENTFKYETPVPVVNEQPVQPNVEPNVLQQPVNPMPGVVPNQQTTMTNQINNNQNM